MTFAEYRAIFSSTLAYGALEVQSIPDNQRMGELGEGDQEHLRRADFF